MARTLEFTISGKVDTIVLVEEGDFDGDGYTELKFTVTVDESAGSTADLRALFWDVLDDDVAGWGVYQLGGAASPDATDMQFHANDVVDLGNGANIRGNITNKGRFFDAGVEFGTPGKSKDDIQETMFVVTGDGEDLSLDDIGGQRFGVRYTSYGNLGGNREGSLKIEGVAPYAPDAIDDTAKTIGEDPFGIEIDIDVLANDTDEDGDTLTVTSVDANGSNGGTFSINPDGTINFDPGSDFDALNTGEFQDTTTSYYISDGNGGTDWATITVTVEGFDPGAQTNTDADGDIVLSLTTAERTIDGTTPASATITLPDTDSDVAFIIDLSTSTMSSFGSTVGDVNGDGQSDTILDAQIASYLDLLDEIVAGAAGVVNVNLIGVSDDSASVDVYEVTTSDGEQALRSALTGLAAFGGTNFEPALQIADAFFDGLNNEVAYFLSDGLPADDPSDWDDEVASLDGKSVQIIAAGVGPGSSLADLDTIDNTGGAEQLTDVDDLSAAPLDSMFDVIDFRIEVNGVEVAGIDETDLIESAFGFVLPEETLSGLDVGEADVNSVIAYADISTDGDDSDAEVFLQVENLVNGVIYDDPVALRNDPTSGYGVVDGAKAMSVTYLGANVGADTFPGWQAILAGADGAGGYSLLWQHANGNFGIWDLDGSGAFRGMPDMAKAGLYEKRFQFDIDGDKAIGEVINDIETIGVGLQHGAASGYGVVDGAKAMSVTYLGDQVGAKSFPGWQAIQAGADGDGGYSLLWKHANGTLGIWDLDSSGAFVGMQDMANAVLYEDRFQFDINGDGVIGDVIVDIEAVGVGLQSGAASGYGIVDGAGALNVTYLGDTVGADTFAGWQAIHAGADGDGGYSLLWQHANGSLGIWDLDSSGAFVAMPDMANAVQYEDRFQFDINGDNAIGDVVIDIETVGIGLQSGPASGYGIVDGAGVLNVTYLGDPVGADTFAGWQAIHAGADGDGGYSLLWQHANGSFGIWDLDSYGAFVGMPDMANAVQYEDRFQFDINGDSGIGDALI